MKWYEKHWTSVSNSSAGRDILMIYISLGLFFTLLYKQTTTIHWAHHTKQISFIIQRVMIYYIYVSFPYPIFCFRQAGNCTKCSSLWLWMEAQLFFLESTCSVSPFPSLLVSRLSLSAVPHVSSSLSSFLVLLVSCLLFFCSTCPPLFSYSFNATLSAPPFLCIPPPPSLSQLLSLFPSLSSFDPCCLFSPAVFSLIWSVSLQGCNTSVLSPNTSWRSLQTFHHSAFPEQSMLSGVLMCPRSLSLLPYLYHTAVSYSFLQSPSCWQWYHI